MPVLNYRDPIDGTFKPLSAGQSIIPVGDFNACTATGLYSIASNATNGMGIAQAQASIGILQAFAIDATHINQVFYGGSNSVQPEIWTRSCNAGTWSRWESIFGRPNALGSFDIANVNGIYTLAGTGTSGPGVTGQGLLTYFGNNVGNSLQTNGIQTWTSFVTGEMWQRQFSASGAWSAWARILGVPTGGAQGAILRKNTATNYDVGWAPQSGTVVQEQSRSWLAASWGATASTTYAVISVIPAISFTKQFAGTWLEARFGCSNFITGAAGACTMGVSPTNSSGDIITNGIFFFNALSTHQYWMGLVGISGRAVATYNFTWWIKTQAGTVAMNSDSSDSLWYNVREIWP